MNFVLKISCPDRQGVVADIATRLSAENCNIIESSQFFQPDPGTLREDGIGQFFMRIECTSENANADKLDQALDGFRDAFNAEVTLTPLPHVMPTILMVSKFDHCLQDIFYRVATGTLPIRIAAIVSNHEDSRSDAERFDIPYYVWPVTKENKTEQEGKLDSLIQETGAELIVLARYMQILSDNFSSRYFGQIINIHHSFLPAFKGAKPYHRAWERGVKHIGATAHYVTPDLDEGPIIEQETERVSHSSDAEDLVRRGRDIEARVLSRAIRLHAEQRVFINRSRTVVFQP
ncbi:MAG: formyltetrahydrofolate deformylase [Alphaproteobacteria bacterium]|nr:MAG: formyltetrahydrofolate deformylase [Alphaproteobacteria bacterium]